MFAVNVTFCLVASVLLTLVMVQAEIVASRGRLLADAEIAAVQSAIWSVPAPQPERVQLR